MTLRDPGPARELLLREVALFPQPPYKSMVVFSTRHSAIVVPAARGTRPAAATTTRRTRHHGSVLESAAFFSELDRLTFSYGLQRLGPGAFIGA